MKDLIILAAVVIIPFNAFSEFQMRNIDKIDNQKMQQIVKDINDSNQLNLYERSF